MLITDALKPRLRGLLPVYVGTTSEHHESAEKEGAGQNLSWHGLSSLGVGSFPLESLFAFEISSIFMSCTQQRIIGIVPLSRELLARSFRTAGKPYALPPQSRHRLCSPSLPN